LHAYDGRPYYLGAFLIGAYQEILGDLHNLFGDTNAAHVSLSEGGEIVVDAIVKGDTVREVLNYVQFDANDLLHRMQTAVDEAVRRERINSREAGMFLRFYEAGLAGYTYLEEPGD
jgi:arginine decarboxylase